MSTSDFFTITSHTSPCSYIRQYPHSIKHSSAILHLAVKEYQPINPPSSEESVTIIAAHGNGFPKECFEPLWSDLLATKTPIHSIWAADMFNQSSSYALNAPYLGDDPNYLDHSLDLLLMINTFRARMKPPFIGVAHSMGCAQLVYLASIHPALFHSLVLIDPVIQALPPLGPNAALFSSMRRDVWPTRSQAETQISKNPFFRSMDPRALYLFLKYALRDTPDGSVVLSTPKAQEAWTFIRSNLQPLSEDTVEGRRVERLLNPDVEPFSLHSRAKCIRPEMLPICDALPHIRPRTFLLYGEDSHINTEAIREYHIDTLGSGRGGNGGVKEGGVVHEVLGECGHMCVFEKPTEIAEKVGVWLGKEVQRWKQEKEFWERLDTGKSKNGRTELGDGWTKVVKEASTAERPTVGEKAKL